MIQRIQSVYLALAAILSIVVLFMPIYNDVRGLDELLVAVPAVIVALLSVFAIFQFKDRMKQLKICKLDLLVSTFTAAVVLLNFFESGDDFQIGIVLHVLANVFIVLAMSGIKADEKLVRESDRLR